MTQIQHGVFFMSPQLDVHPSWSYFKTFLKPTSPMKNWYILLTLLLCWGWHIFFGKKCFCVGMTDVTTTNCVIIICQIRAVDLLWIWYILWFCSNIILVWLVRELCRVELPSYVWLSWAELSYVKLSWAELCQVHIAELS